MYGASPALDAAEFGTYPAAFARFPTIALPCARAAIGASGWIGGAPLRDTAPDAGGIGGLGVVLVGPEIPLMLSCWPSYFFRLAAALCAVVASDWIGGAPGRDVAFACAFPGNTPPA